MALVDDREAPDYVPTTNELDKIPDVPAGTPTEIRLGTAVLMSMVNPPEAGSYIDISARLYIKHAGFDQNTPDSPKVPVRLSKIIVAWPMGEKMPPPPEKKKTKAQEDAAAEAAAADDQPALFDDEPEVLGDAVDELLGEELADAAGVDVDGDEDQDGEYYDDGQDDTDTEDEADNVVPFNGGPTFSDGEG